MTSLKSEIAQKRPFASKEEEALLNILRTADCLQREFQRRSREWGVTSTQYNVLRIFARFTPRRTYLYRARRPHDHRPLLRLGISPQHFRRRGREPGIGHRHDQ